MNSSWGPETNCDGDCGSSYQALLPFFFFLVLPLYCHQPISFHPCAHMLSHVTPWTAARQAPLSMDFSRQEYWSGLPFPSPQPLLLNVPSGRGAQGTSEGLLPGCVWRSECSWSKGWDVAAMDSTFRCGFCWLVG